MIAFNSDTNSFFSSLINDNTFVSGFCTKAIGDARRSDIILSYLSESNIPFQKIIIPEQIHSVNIANYSLKTPENIEKIDETDGVVTADPNVVLTAITADCLPAVFVDKKKEIIGISHQGWRGGLKRMVVRMVERMIEAGSRKEDINIALGPAIGACCYNIDEERYYDFMDELESYADKIITFHHGRRYLNLLLVNYLLLIDNGIPKENIDFFPFCTNCDKNRFFSNRRDTKQDFGEMLSFVMIKNTSTGMKGSISSLTV